LLNHFETYVKRDFADTGDPNEEYYIPAAGAKNNPAARIAGGSIVVTAQDLKAAFDPVVREVVYLVKKQIANIKGEKNDVSAVLLVGGFGQSRYLKKRIEEEIRPISLMCPPNGWSAIARGAVIKGVASRSSAPDWRVSSRKATQHFGIEVQRDFQHGVHDISRRSVEII
jgi:molecular chaperone DnaK (HSP70)